jgi:hypothetical protein
MGLMGSNIMYPGMQGGQPDQNPYGVITEPSVNYESKLALFMERPIENIVVQIEELIQDQENCKLAQDRLEREQNSL